MSIYNSQSFKYKGALVGKTANHSDRKISVKDTKIVVLLNYLRTEAKVRISIGTVSTKDSVNITKRSNEGFKRPAYWGNYQSKPEKVTENGKKIYELLNESFQGIR